MANCLQFNKETQLYPGNSGASKTRALVCELLAIRLLKEFSTRQLIDALSYDFYPLQGATGNTTPAPNWEIRSKHQPRVARISTLEIAIRAQCKRFLAHPLVVQQLEGIWAGTIVFHSAADNLHRPLTKVIPNQNRGYGAIGSSRGRLKATPDTLQPSKQRDHQDAITVTVRRSVTLYNPKEASLFKLSRLRVPRYRQFLSTLSFAVLLGLFLAVLIERSLSITSLEVIFWFWSAGFMLDELVGFNEQGFSLYIMSFWNAFDLGILLLLIAYYCMRLYGIVMPDVRKHHVADMAYDVLASNAVLLFPRLFSVLDHYRYFSQLLIAFRMMAVDLVAVFILILISCSGFFVAFTLSFGNIDFDTHKVAYSLFQILMGFTPAAWEQWDDYNTLGKSILTLFLFICHFLIVTILITVLTNSFMAIVQNANEEHQFVFAVNAISMVKSDALFSYIAPTNILAWLVTPLRYFLPFRQFVQINRTIIKVTHFPILFSIYTYERIWLRRNMADTFEMVEERGRKLKPFDNPGTALNLFSPNQPKLREPSVATFHKDRALAEVFRRPFKDDDTMRMTQKSQERRKTSNVVNNWMQTMGPEGKASPPIEQDRDVVDRLEARRRLHRESQILRRRSGRGRNFTAATMSIASDPEESVSNTGRFSNKPASRREKNDFLNTSMEDLPEHTDADGDDELVTNEDDDVADQTTIDGRRSNFDRPREVDYFTPHAANPVPPSIQQPSLSFAKLPKEQSPKQSKTRPAQGRTHNRTLSTNTILFNPLPSGAESSSSPSREATTAKNSAKNTSGNGAVTPLSTSIGRRTPKRPPPGVARVRPIMPARTAFQSTPNLHGLTRLHARDTSDRNRALALDIGSDIGDNKAIGGGFVGAMPASLATQMGFAKRMQEAKAREQGANEDQQRISKIMLARMNMLEQGFKEVLHEVKDWKREDTSVGRSTGDDRMAFERRAVRRGGGGSGGGGGGRRAAKKEKGSKDDGKGRTRSVEAEQDAEWVDENPSTERPSLEPTMRQYSQSH